MATIAIPKKDNDRELRLSALHEVWHLLLADITTMAEGAVNAERVLTEEHKVIAKIENYINKLEDGMDKKGGKGKPGKGGKGTMPMKSMPKKGCK